MYYRISGAPFTIKNNDEKKEFLDIINSNQTFSDHLVCRGVNVEQFTGKVNGVIISEKDNPNRVYVFKCDGNFPTLKLYPKFSAAVYVIEFPVSSNKQVIVESEKTIVNKLEEVNDEEEIVVEDAFSVDPFERTEPVDPIIIPSFSVVNPETPINESVTVDPIIIPNDDNSNEVLNDDQQPKKRGRKKKNH